MCRLGCTPSQPPPPQLYCLTIATNHLLISFVFFCISAILLCCILYCSIWLFCCCIFRFMYHFVFLKFGFFYLNFQILTFRVLCILTYHLFISIFQPSQILLGNMPVFILIKTSVFELLQMYFRGEEYYRVKFKLCIWLLNVLTLQ